MNNSEEKEGKKNKEKNIEKQSERIHEVLLALHRLLS